MQPRGAPRTGLSSWAIASLALAAYAGAATVVLALDPSALPAPWWALAVPPVVYAIVVVAASRRVSVLRVLVATGVLCAVQGLLLAGTATVAAVVAPDVRLPVLPGTLGLLTLVCVPCVLAPLRTLITGRPRQPRRPARPASGWRATALPKAPVTAPGMPVPRPASPTAPPSRPWPAPTRHPAQPQGAAPDGRTAKPSAHVLTAPTPLAPLPGLKPPVSVAPPAPPPASPNPPEPAPVAPTPVSVPTARAAEPAEETIRIPFTRVADQLPAEIFNLPRELVGANLREADHLRIPHRLVRPQLPEGLVQVGWRIVAEQFPREALALPDEEIVRRLPNGVLVLPLDEVVRQIPRDVFELSAPAPDIQALEDFPLPFQPHLPTPASAEPVAAEPMVDRFPELPGPAVEPTLPEPLAPEPAAWPEATLGTPEPTPPGAEPQLTAAGPASPPSPTDDAPRTPDAHRLAALLGPLLSPVTAESYEGLGTTFLILAPPALPGVVVADVAERVLPFLTDSRLPEPALQATVRATAMTVVITPLAGAPNSALVAATTVGASLALLERLCLRAAAVPVAHGRPSAAVQASSPGAELQQAPPEPTVQAVAESLQAFGPVTTTVLQDPDGGLVVYLFLPRGLEARSLGGFARDLHRALVGSPAGGLGSIILRVGTGRLLVRTVESARSTVVVAGGGPVDRPGMARLELERAAARLGRL